MNGNKLRVGADAAGDEDDDESAVSVRTCVGCGIASPPTQTAYTLISAKHGWRLTRTKMGEELRYEWRCPECFGAFREAGGACQGDPTLAKMFESGPHPVGKGPR